MLKEHVSYIKDLQSKAKLPKRVEIILVDDGSKDKTLEFIKKMTVEHPEENTSTHTCFVRGLRQMVNQGKGAAVKVGALYSRGEFILMLDADGATHFSEIEGILNKARKVRNQNNFSCVIGSRNLVEGQVKRTAIRKFLNTCMITLCGIVLGSRLKDTQCGFKIWSREAA